VVVLEVPGPLSEVIDDLGRAIEQALTEGTRGVVCDLSAVPEGAEPAAVEVLATAGRHVRDWSGNPVAVACPDPAVRAALAADHVGGHLIVTASMFSAVSMVLLAPTAVTKRLRLAPHPTAQTAAREFVTQTLKDWGLDPILLAANLVVSELVTNSVMHATADIDLSIAWNRRALRLTVGDDSSALAPQRYSSWDLPESRPRAVADLARAFGVLPTADDGRVTWAVLNATSPSAPAARRSRPFTPAPHGV
jgi:hypothetical protein